MSNTPPPSPLPDASPQAVDIVLYPGFKLIEAVATMTVFEYANVHLAQRGLARGYEVRFAAVEPGPVWSDMQVPLQATRRLGEAPEADTAVIVGAREIEQVVERNPALTDWVAEWAVRAAAPDDGTFAPPTGRLVALCSGSFFLAAAGVLDGQSATTHWSVAPRLQALYPAVDVDADAIYLRSGRVWTSAGVTAGIDLVLALVEEDHGRALALEVARDLVVYLKRPGGQSQFSVHLASQGTANAGIRAVQDWLLQHLDADLSVPALASRAAMSERNFRRVFGKEVGQSPIEFVETARLDAARRLLEDGDLPLKAIAHRVGLMSDQTLRKLFVKRLGVSPQDYRARFGRG